MVWVKIHEPWSSRVCLIDFAYLGEGILGHRTGCTGHGLVGVLNVSTGLGSEGCGVVYRGLARAQCLASSAGYARTKVHVRDGARGVALEPFKGLRGSKVGRDCLATAVAGGAAAGDDAPALWAGAP